MIDGHAHLNEIAGIDDAMRRAVSAGVKRVIAVGMDIASNLRNLELAQRFPGRIFPAVGYHPWSITTEGIEENLAFIAENLPHCVALGEVGLDYGARVKKKVQRPVFERLLDLALRADRPVIVHSRYFHSRTWQMTVSSGVERAVFHWYSGPEEILGKILDSGYFISVTPALQYSPQHRAAAAFAPLERILVETDAPVEYRGRISEPADLVITLQELAKIKGISTEEAIHITSENTRRLYRI